MLSGFILKQIIKAKYLNMIFVNKLRTRPKVKLMT